MVEMEALNFYKFQRDENLKHQWLVKIKQLSIQYNMPDCVMLISAAGKIYDFSCP